ncbi:MAG: helix-turn-helix domain-containing protein [Actinomycetota bacterium]|nr:helix-turn-helix domain-containing protein [Actinomycetota bacterium]
MTEVARRLGVSEKTARRYVKSGTLPSVFVGGAYRVSEEDLEEYLQGARVTPAGDPPKVEAPPSPQPSLDDVLEEERRLLKRARPLLSMLNREALYWEHVARSGQVSPDVRAVVRNHRQAVMEALDVLLEDVAEGGPEWVKDRHGPSRIVRRELQSAFNRWDGAWHALEDAYLEGLTGGQLEEARQAREEQEERSRRVHERLRAGEAV